MDAHIFMGARMLKIELLLRSRLIKEALSSVLMAAGFCVLQERDESDRRVMTIVGVDDREDLEVVRGRQPSGDNIVILASKIDILEADEEVVAVLSGILTYDLSADALVQSLRLISTGERVFPHDLVSGRSLPAPSPGVQPRSDAGRLSPREREVLSYLLGGHANKVIARRLGTSEATVKVHLKNLLRKIKMDNRTQAAIWALSNLPELKSAPAGFV